MVRNNGGAISGEKISSKEDEIYTDEILKMAITEIILLQN